MKISVVYLLYFSFSRWMLKHEFPFSVRFLWLHLSQRQNSQYCSHNHTLAINIWNTTPISWFKYQFSQGPAVSILLDYSHFFFQILFMSYIRDKYLVTYRCVLDNFSIFHVYITTFNSPIISIGNITISYFSICF